ncbi:MAG: lactonase family protein [Actinomycetota bacterium]|nr:lactonase family protein [Actinomycetota bacterium]
MASGAVYVQSNEPQNQVIAFRRAADGGLTRFGSYDTGGAGNADPHLPSQGSVVLTGDGSGLLVTNVASDDVSVFTVGDDGELELLGRTPVGPAPRSVAEHGGLVYVLATGTPGLRGFRLGAGGLEAIDGADHALADNADPAQVGFTPDGSAVLVTERGTDSISAFAVGADGRLGQSVSVRSSGPTPYGFAVTATATLVVTEAFRAENGAAAASSYSVTGTNLSPVTKSAGNGRSEICWAVVTRDGRYAFTTNFADGAVSRYSIGQDGKLTLDAAAAGVTVDGRPGLRDEGLTADGRHLYAIDADSGSVFGWQVGEDGALAAVGSWDGLPLTVAGLACR